MRKRTPIGHYSRTMPRVLGGWAFSYGGGTPVPQCSTLSSEGMVRERGLRMASGVLHMYDCEHPHLKPTPLNPQPNTLNP